MDLQRRAPAVPDQVLRELHASSPRDAGCAHAAVENQPSGADQLPRMTSWHDF